MAQKQFKIGLSNTDKQNMAQDVYERLLALTFPEYETTESYEIGDFVVYNDQLYKCISATSGAWDSSKWQLATLNDLVADIENAVAFVNDKANVDGNYPTMTVGVADNLSPYDEEAGIKQSAPFNFQASGTNNGSNPLATVGELALLKEKRGNTVVVNQKLQNPNFNGTDNWTSSGTISASNNVLSFTASGRYDNFSQNNLGLTGGHKYLIMWQHKGTAGSFGVYFSSGDYCSNNIDNQTHNSFTFGATIKEITSNANTLFFQDNKTSDWTEQQFKDIYLVDLTQWFNGDIPQDILDNPSNFFRYYQGSLAYNEGELVNANGRYLKAIVMNQWDEEWIYNYGLESKNFIKVIPGATYYLKCKEGTAYFNKVLEYDAQQNQIIENSAVSQGTFTVSANTAYIKFRMNAGYGTTYNNDISINLYYEDEPRCLTYEPYKVLTNTDTGTEVLRSAGSVRDYKDPDGTITRRIKVGDLSNASVTVEEYYSSYTGFACFKFSKFADAKDYGKYRQYAICDKYLIKEFAISDVNYICGNAQQNHYVIILPTGTTLEQATTIVRSLSIFYELDEPTAEQGTPYSENLVIDDFGSMDFEGTNGVPQGNLIFYPVDYKAYLDTLHKYTDGDPDNLALKSDLAVVNEKIGAKIPECPTTTDGTYVLKATVNSGTVVYSWVLEE